MNALLNDLRERGCDVDSAMTRFLNKEELYSKCYGRFLADPSFSSLGDALRRKDVDTAFRSAHALKGIITNMGLTPLAGFAERLVEPLRAGKYDESLLAVYDELMREMRTFRRVGARNGLYGGEP